MDRGYRMSGWHNPAERARRVVTDRPRPVMTYVKGKGDVRLRLGIDVACKAAHQVSCADETGRFPLTGRRFRTIVEDLEKLWASLPAADEMIPSATRRASSPGWSIVARSRVSPNFSRPMLL